MSSVSGLLVPNNFDIYAKSIVTTDPIPSEPASQLYSDNDTNIISIGASSTPTTGQILTATSGTTATWQTPSVAPAGPANRLYSASDTNVIDVGNAPNPTGLQVLTATSANAAIWVSPEVSTNNSVTMTNKTLVASTNNVTASSLWSSSGTNTISVRGAAAPFAGQVLTATNSTTATWQTPSGSGGFPGTTLFTTSVNVLANSIPGNIATFDTAGVNGQYFMKGDIISYNSDNYLIPTPITFFCQWTVRGGLIENLFFGRYSANAGGFSEWSQMPNPVGNGTTIVNIKAVDLTNNVQFEGWWTVYYKVL